MNKFRKWFFKFLTGYELIDYERILKLAGEINDCSNGILNDHKKTLSLAKDVNDRCGRLLELCKDVIADETLD